MRRLILISLISCLISFTGVVNVRSEGIGYWKTHDAEREAVISDAVSDSIDTLNVFKTESELRDYLTLKAAKTMEEKAKQQLAALLLSIAAGYLDPLDNLTTSELVILQVTTPIFGAESTLGEAVVKIQDAIITEVNLEGAKDLSEELNQRKIN